MADRTTKLLLLAIAVGLWMNVANQWLRPVPVQAAEQDYAEAVRWYRLAAEQGYAMAQVSLALQYILGEGVQRDFVKAHMWANLAASRLSGEARELAVNARALALRSMTADQVAEAQRLAREWEAAHPREP